MMAQEVAQTPESAAGIVLEALFWAPAQSRAGLLTFCYAGQDPGWRVGGLIAEHCAHG